MSRLGVAPATVQAIAGVQGDVAAELTRLAGAADDAPGAVQSLGVIAAPVDAALTTTLASRRSTLRTAAASSEALDAILRQAARLYERGDVEAAQELERAANVLEADAAGGAGSATATPEAGGGADGAGQLAGQIGQQVGSVASTVGQAMSGLMQGLAAIPAMALQAVQGAGQSGGALDPAGAAAEEQAGDRRSDGRDEDDENGDTDAPDTEDARPDAEAAAGEYPGALPPVGPDVQGTPQAERPAPAQTRPASVG